MTVCSRTSRSLLLAALLLTAGSCLNSPLDKTAQVRGIHLDAELARKRADVALRLGALRTGVQGWYGPNTPSLEVRQRMQMLAQQARDAAVFTLEQERVVASRKFDVDDRLREFLEILYQETDELIALGERVLSAPPPASLSCRTDISGEPESSSVHYMAYGDYVDDRPDSAKEWLSYNKGARLDIGIYQFRVTPPDEVAYYEKVLILSDPFESRLKRLRP